MKRATKLDIFNLSFALNFNPRPREEGDCDISYKVIPCKYFNPRPREEGDVVTAVDGIAGHDISIHALVKRATAIKWILNH